MRVLKLTLTLVMLIGCFRPLSWTSLSKRVIYNIYRTFIITILYTFSILQLIDVALNINSPDDITNNLYMLLNVSVSGYKLLIMWINYDNFAALINNLTEVPFKPENSGEMGIRRKFDKLIRTNTLRYAILIETSWSCTILISLFVDFRHNRLTHREWVPYDYDSSYMLFLVTYGHQLLSTFYCANVNIACDSFICGLLMHVCCQIEILEYRLKKNMSEQNTIEHCIRHHNSIFEFAHLINVRFTEIIGFQFITSTLVICSSLYKLSKSTFNADSIGVTVYMCCMLTQIFIYCWFGHKVKLKSLQLTDSIFQLEWPTWNNDVKKNLLIIMKRTQMPIEIITAYIFPLNLDSFVLLLKASYSTYNLLVKV